MDFDAAMSMFVEELGCYSTECGHVGKHNGAIRYLQVNAVWGSSSFLQPIRLRVGSVVSLASVSTDRGAIRL